MHNRLRLQAVIPMAFAAPFVVVVVAFLVLPLAWLVIVGARGNDGWRVYVDILTNRDYALSLLNSIVLSALVTLVTLIVSAATALFLQRTEFVGKSLLTTLITLPLAFPGVVVGFMIIMLGGRVGIAAIALGWLTGHRMVFAYTLVGLFVGYLYFSIPRTLLTIMAAIEKLDAHVDEAARSLGATPFRVLIDVTLPALQPALVSGGALCFATSMGALGTVLSLGTRISVLPLTIYSEFILYSNVAIAAALSVVLAVITVAMLAIARAVSGASHVAAAGG